MTIREFWRDVRDRFLEGYRHPEDRWSSPRENYFQREDDDWRRDRNSTMRRWPRDDGYDEYRRGFGAGSGVGGTEITSGFFDVTRPDAGEFADDERPNREVTDRILGALGKPPSLVRYVTDRLGHDRRYALDASRLRATGWRPRQSFADGLAATVEWYRAERPWWEAIKSGAYREYYDRMYADRLRGGGEAPAARSSSP